MKKKRHTVEQIIRILRQVDEGCEVEVACREHNIAKVVEITKTGPLEKLVWAPIKDPDNEIKTIHNRTEDPHPSGC